jgi:hypothetical protein
MSCREFAAVARETDDNTMAFSMNIACALLGGSFLEARLNELIAEMAYSAGRRLKPSRKFWVVLFDEQKFMPMQQKWDLIASMNRRGKRWNRAVEPFQSYELLLTLRNELAHYKGSVTSVSEPPVNKLKALMGRFKGRPDPMMRALRVASWIDELLSAPELGTWISSVVQEFEKNIHLYLFGQNPKVVRVKTPQRIRRARGHAS